MFAIRRSSWKADPPPINYTYQGQRNLLRLWTLLQEPGICDLRGTDAGEGVVYLSDTRVLKVTGSSGLVEAHTLRYLHEHTSVPVPQVHLAFKHKGRVFTVMERMFGERLSESWEERDTKSRAAILGQIKEMLDELREIPPPGGRMANVVGGPLLNPRLPGNAPWGPYAEVRDFHYQLRGGIGQDTASGMHEVMPRLDELVSWQEMPWGKPVLSHGELCTDNILVDGDTVTAVLGWECAGWWPAYWDYTSACQLGEQGPWGFSVEEVGALVEPQPTALEMEGVRRRYFGDSGLEEGRRLSSSSRG